MIVPTQVGERTINW
jgi:uncharacterized protein